MIRTGKWLMALLFLPQFFTGSLKAVELRSLLEPVPGAPVGSSGRSAAGADSEKGGQPLLLTDSELLKAIQQDLPKRFPIKGELRVYLLKPWVALQLPGQDFFAECIQTMPQGLSTNMTLTVRGISGGKIVGEWPIQVRVEQWREIWVAGQRLDRGQVLSPGMFVAQKVDALRESSQPIFADSEIVGLEIAQAVSEGRPITRRDIMERSLVKRGQFVDAMATDGGLNIRMRAMALEAGAAGAVIRVKNIDSNKEFVGQVIGENQVQVRF